MMILISHSSLLWIIVFIISLLASHFVRTVRWKIIIGSVKSDTSLVNLFGALMVGYGVNCAIPRLGEISRAVVLGRWEKISKTSMFGTIIIERVIDIVSFLLCIFVSLIIFSGNLYSTFPWLKTSLYIVSVIMILTILFLFLLYNLKEKLSKVLAKLVGKLSEKLAVKLSNILEMLIIGFGSLKGIKNYLKTIFLTILLLLLYSLNSYLGFFIVGLEKISSVDFGMAWIVMSISAIGIMIPTPGGIGSYHTLVKSVLVLLFSFSEEISLAYAVITHFISYILFVITALFFFFWLDMKYSKQNGRDENIVSNLETKVDAE
jgi:uncharacterized protein (TIRG00374 family)